jgi:hypothetical protein
MLVCLFIGNICTIPIVGAMELNIYVLYIFIRLRYSQCSIWQHIQTFYGRQYVLIIYFSCILLESRLMLSLVRMFVLAFSATRIYPLVLICTKHIEMFSYPSFVYFLKFIDTYSEMPQ